MYEVIIYHLFNGVLKNGLLLLKKKSKAIRVQAVRVPGSWGSQISRQLAHWGGKHCQPIVLAAYTLRKYFCYTFLLEAVSTAGPQCGWKDYANEK